MKKIFLIIIALSCINCKAQTKTDTVMRKIENFNTYTDPYKDTYDGNYYYKPDSTRIVEINIKEPVINEYPKGSFIKIYKKFYESGELHIEGVRLGDGGVKIGVWRAYDEQGYQIEELDEDKKFGKIKPDDILQFLEKEGFINLKTGEGRYDKYGHEQIDYYYTRSSTEKKPFKNIFIPSKWKIKITKTIGLNQYEVTNYKINGETGEVIEKTTKIEGHTV